MKSIIILLFILLCPGIAHKAFAHDIVGELENISPGEAAKTYLLSGFKHIIPLGWDHILFILSLFFFSPKLKSVLWQSLTFTIAHSLTLALASLGWINISPSVVEPLIAATIIFVALQNIFAKQLKATRIGLVFFFGLIHGLGFAGALNDLGLPGNAYAISLFMFNLGVELGQLTIILLAFILVGKWFSDKSYYRKFIVAPNSAAIAAIAFFWLVQRI